MAFRFDKLTQKAQEALQQAQEIANQGSHQAIHPLHLLISLTGEREGIVRPVLEKCGIQPDALVADNFKDEYVSTEHLLLGIASQKNEPAGSLLNKQGATKDAILKALVTVRGTQRVTDQNPESKYQALERYAVDLTDKARRGKLDPVIGRDEEIRRLMQVLSRRTKNNPVLIGEPGVGKTAIVEGLAQRIVKGDIPDPLRSQRPVAVGLEQIVWGTQLRREVLD